ncbi:putative late blight resistance protein homolog R1A-10, partial [Capsicum annuum]|uniref:putative late blight resistance protein homolog R1A-10 n=1 Tax=Capsicum annuum TaxID=4072 RepID=UPI001FB163A4
KIKLIRKEVSNLPEEILKNNSLVVVFTPKNPVERKPLTTGKIIVGFKEETNWLISKLTSGPKDLDVISITGMPGSGKTTLAYKVYNDESSSEDIDVAEKLRKQLYGKRYLIVLDDMWDTTTWNDLTRPFPEAEKGSLEKKKAVWIEVRNNLNSFIFGSEVDVMKVIELSYDHLPHHMKPRILYLASFPKDTAMDRVMLKMYWRAEGIVEQTEMKSLEEEMGIYLDKLISSSLVIAFNEIGDYSSCQLHALVHDFCLIKAREEKWFVQISSSDPSSSSDLMASIVIINYDKEHFKPNNFVLLNSIKKRHSGKHLCSSAITGDKIEDRLPDACHLRDLRLLRVLDLSPSFMM